MVAQDIDLIVDVLHAIEDGGVYGKTVENYYGNRRQRLDLNADGQAVDVEDYYYC